MFKDIQAFFQKPEVFQQGVPVHFHEQYRGFFVLHEDIQTFFNFLGMTDINSYEDILKNTYEWVHNHPYKERNCGDMVRDVLCYLGKLALYLCGPVVIDVICTLLSPLASKLTCGAVKPSCLPIAHKFGLFGQSSEYESISSSTIDDESTVCCFGG